MRASQGAQRRESAVFLLLGEALRNCSCLKNGSYFTSVAPGECLDSGRLCLVSLRSQMSALPTEGCAREKNNEQRDKR
ncbi:hypothetical protein NDU88_000027 [Pleurodeles waltl]|uniref:Secreted protein n=1 Tax=Pleurodeles waltl TaxID=8319 RepID=A0AAV7VW81_PLEWA|nr:hypothetical protein NDU88_000027 [Pleurodeles waltl]